MERMRKLVDILNKYAYEYYVLDAPTVSDKEYDALYDELVKLEKETGERLFDSPTRRVGGEPVSAFKKHKHIARLYSLDKATTTEELYAFDKRINKSGTDIEYTVEYKFDGLTICISYENGKFIRATTRGNGTEGEDVTAQVLTIKSFPLAIDYDGIIEVQGEAIIRLSTLEKYNKKAEEPLKNARNAVAGAIRNTDPKITEQRKPEILFYNVNYMSKGELKTQTECVEFLRKNGFKVHPFLKVCKNIDEVIFAIDEIEVLRKNLDVLTDGAVVKVNSMAERKKLGFTDKFPRWAIAFKFEAEETTTILKDVIWQVGRTGKLTPLGLVEPVNLAGATVSKATLNNYGDLMRKKIKKGARVLIRRSNEVIPEILGVTEVYSDSEEILKPTVCPYCGSTLVEKGANLFCPNENCRPRVIAKLCNFASKNGMDIDGLKEMTIGALYDNLGVKKFADIYNLKKEQLLKLDKFKQTKTDNLIFAIEKSKDVDLANFIFALGIENVGKKTAKDLAENFQTFFALTATNKDSLLGVSDIGNIVADCIIDYFKDDDNKKEIDALLRAGVKIKQTETHKKSGVFSGEKIVLTGTLANFSREQATKIIEENGGVIASSVSKNTTMVLCGESAGSKLEKAKQLGIKVIDEETFKNLIKT